MATTTPSKPAPVGQLAPWWWAWPAVAVVGAYLAAHLLGGMPGWVFWAIGIAAAALGVGWGTAVFDSITYGTDLTRAAASAAALGSAAAAGWVGWAATVGDPLAGLQWLALIGGFWTGVWLLIGSLAPAQARRLAGAPAEPAAAAAPVEGGPAAQYRAALDAAGLTGLAVDAVTVSPSGGVEIVDLVPAPAPGRKAITFAGLQDQIPALVTELSRILEAARGIDLDDTAVLARRGRSAHRYRLQVTTIATAQGEIGYRTEGPRGWYEPWQLGRLETDEPLTLTMADAEQGATHATAIMYKGGGKSVLAHNMIAEVTRSAEGEIWVGASDKLVPLVYPWLAPWIEGRTDRPVLDRVAGQDQGELLAMLRDALAFTAYSNDRLGRDPVRQVRAGAGGLVVLIDESSGCFTHPQKLACHDGIARNASEIVAEIKQLARSAQVTVVDLSQYGLFGERGSAGAKQVRNTGVGIVGKVKRAQDAHAAIPAMPPGCKPTALTGHRFYVAADLDDTAEVVRAKAARLEGARIDPVALAHTPYRRGLDPEVTGRLASYADRWDPARHVELVAWAASEGLDWPVPAADPGPARPTAIPAARDGQEAPVTGPDRPTLPEGWSDPDADVWAMFEGRDTDAPPKRIRTDITGIAAAADRLREELAPHLRPARVPDPLGRVLRLLDHPKAPREWVSTADLAVELDRVADDADDTARRRAVEQLGMELRRQTGLNAVRLSKSVDPARPMGWSVAELRKAGDRLRGQGDGVSG